MNGLVLFYSKVSQSNILYWNLGANTELVTGRGQQGGATRQGKSATSRVRNSFGTPAWEGCADKWWRPAGGSAVQVDIRSATGR